MLFNHKGRLCTKYTIEICLTHHNKKTCNKNRGQHNLKSNLRELSGHVILPLRFHEGHSQLSCMFGRCWKHTAICTVNHCVFQNAWDVV